MVSHDHYGPEVNEALRHFRELFVTYNASANYHWKMETTNRSDVMQSAWNALARARKKETGVAYYIPPKK
jgi:hypothetical protein